MIACSPKLPGISFAISFPSFSFLPCESHCERQRVVLSFSIDDTEKTEVSFREFTLDQALSYVQNRGWFISRDWSIPFRGGTTSMETSTHPSCGKFTKSWRAEFFLQRRAIREFLVFQDFLSFFFRICILETLFRLPNLLFHFVCQLLSLFRW